MALSWQHILSEIGLSDSDIEKDANLVRFTGEEIIKEYQSIITSINKDKQNLTTCYACRRKFGYPFNTNKVLCPFCQTQNQCVFVYNAAEMSAGPVTATLPSYVTGINQPAQPQPYGTNLPVYAQPYVQTSSYVPPYVSNIPQTNPPPMVRTNTAPVNILPAPLGFVPKEQEKALAESEQLNVDFTKLSDAQYKGLISHVKKRVSLKIDGLDDWKLVSDD